MSTPDCPQITLVEALRDGRLGPHDVASMERHLAVCSACRELAHDLERIGDAVRAPLEPLSPLEHQRARMDLLRRASREPAVPAPRRGAWLVMAAAALVAAMAGGFGLARMSATPEHAILAAHLRLDPRITARRETTLRPSDDARFERSTQGGVDLVTLSEGVLDVTVRPLAKGERFVVRTSDAEIEVRATSFRVEAAEGHVRGVAVAEGTVEVRYAGFTAVIPSGGSWRATGGPAAAPAASAEPAASATASAPPPRAAAVASVKRPASRPERSARVPAPVAEPFAPPAPAVVASVAEPSAEAREFADAMRSVGQGEYDAAAARFDAFATAHPHDARADEADYLAAIALQRAGRAGEAQIAARRYLGAHPEGAHRIEARTIAGD
jgi:TolA-binding protein